MDNETEQQEIKPLIYNYIFHILLFIAYFILHLIIYIKIFWIINSVELIFALGTYINILYFLFPIFPLIVIIKKIYKKNIIFILKLLSLILLIVTSIFGLIIFTVFLINTMKSKLFCKECPFNLSIEHLNKVFGPYYTNNKDEEDIKSLCLSRRCILDQINLHEQYPYTYLCNYDPSDEFDDDKIYSRFNHNGVKITTNKQLTCFAISPNYHNLNFQHSELLSYLNLCYYYSNFYRCKRFNEPKNYNIDLDEECPDNNYLLLVYIICILIIIMDIIISLLPWGIEYITFKKVLIIVSIARRKTGSHSSTARSSQISQDNESFKKEKTPIIVLPLEDDNVDNDNDDDNDSKFETDNDLIGKLKNKTIQIQQLKINVFPENGKNLYKSINANQNKNSDRVRLNLRNNDEDTKANISTINVLNENQIRTRNKNIKPIDNTTLNPINIRSIEIKTDSNNKSEI